MNINISELKTLWELLYNNIYCDDLWELWKKINLELAQQLGKDDYLKLVEKNKNNKGA
jgi:hypothetical protein